MRRYLLTLFVTLLIPLFVISQTSETKVSSDAMDGVDFKSFKTFAWLPFVDSVSTGDYDKEMIDNLITEGINSELTDRQLTENTESPDLAVHYILIVGNKTVQETEAVRGKPNLGVGVGFGRGGPSLSVGASSSKTYQKKSVTYREGSIIVEIVDTSSDQIIWRGTANRSKKEDGSLVNPKLVIEDAIPKMFKKFPVKKPKKRKQ